MADTFLFVMARDALAMGLLLAETYQEYVARIEARPTAQEALRSERGHQK